MTRLGLLCISEIVASLGIDYFYLIKRNSVLVRGLLQRTNRYDWYPVTLSNFCEHAILFPRIVECMTFFETSDMILVLSGRLGLGTGCIANKDHFYYSPCETLEGHTRTMLGLLRKDGRVYPFAYSNFKPARTRQISFSRWIHRDEIDRCVRIGFYSLVKNKLGH